MPFKHTAVPDLRVPRVRYRVTDPPTYEAGLWRGGLMPWLDKAALTGWTALKRSNPGGSPLYSDLVNGLVLTLWLEYNCLRPTARSGRSWPERTSCSSPHSTCWVRSGRGLPRPRRELPRPGGTQALYGQAGPAPQQLRLRCHARSKGSVALQPDHPRVISAEVSQIRIGQKRVVPGDRARHRRCRDRKGGDTAVRQCHREAFDRIAGQRH